VSLEQNPTYTYTAPGTYTVELFLSDSTQIDCSLQIVETIEVVDEVGIGNIYEKSISMVPNPSSRGDEVVLEDVRRDGILTIYSGRGQPVIREQFESGSKHLLDTTTLKSGLYIVRFQSDGVKDVVTKLLIY